MIKAKVVDVKEIMEWGSILSPEFYTDVLPLMKELSKRSEKIKKLMKERKGYELLKLYEKYKEIEKLEKRVERDKQRIETLKKELIL